MHKKFLRDNYWPSQAVLKPLPRLVCFIVIMVAGAVVSALLIPDSTTPTRYQATLRIQTPSNNAASQGNINTFYSDFFVSPTTLNLALSKHRNLRMVDIRALVTTTPIVNTNIIELSATAMTPQAAIQLVTDVYTITLRDIHAKRSQMINQLISILEIELRQSQKDAISSFTSLHSLAAEHLMYTSEYAQITATYKEQQKHCNAISKQLAMLQQQEAQQDTLLKIASATPDISTIPGNEPTQSIRLALSLCVGLIMGCGGTLLISISSEKPSKWSEGREIELASMSTVLNQVPGRAGKQF